MVAIHPPIHTHDRLLVQLDSVRDQGPRRTCGSSQLRLLVHYWLRERCAQAPQTPDVRPGVGVGSRFGGSFADASTTSNPLAGLLGAIVSPLGCCAASRM